MRMSERERGPRGVALVVAVSVAALVVVPTSAFGVAGDFTQPATSPEVVGSAPMGITAGNFNGDARTDLAVANSTSGNVTILLNNGSGDFSPPMSSPETAGSGAHKIVSGNFGGDATDDLAVVNQAVDNVTVLINNGSGDFTASTEATGNIPDGIAAADLTGTAHGDLAVPNRDAGGVPGTVTVLINTGANDFTEAGGSPEPSGGMGAISAAAGNFDGDAVKDLAIGNLASLPVGLPPANVTILLGTGTGDFNIAPSSPEPVSAGPTWIATGNFNGDANTDLAAVAQNAGTVSILLGDGTGNFTLTGASPISVGFFASSAAAADLNGDGKTDLAVTVAGGTIVAILLGDGIGGFAPSATSPETVGSTPFSITAADLGGDAATDLATANSGSNNASILLNELGSPAVPPATPPPAQATPTPTPAPTTAPTASKKKCKKPKKGKKAIRTKCGKK